MAENAEDSAATWLTGLNGTDISRNITAFEHSSFGKLPNELLRNIVQYVPKRYLPALARISPVLRELAEERLYQHIILNGPRQTSLYYNENVIWPLYRTSISRPDLQTESASLSAQPTKRETESKWISLLSVSMIDHCTPSLRLP